MALEIGRKFIALRHENAALKGTIDGFRLADGSQVQWVGMVKDVLDGPLSVHSVEEQASLLQESICGPDNADSPLYKLHNHIFGK